MQFEIPALEDMAEELRRKPVSSSAKKFKSWTPPSKNDIKKNALDTALGVGFGGFLMRLAFYITQRLPHLNSYCVICDKPHSEYRHDACMGAYTD